MKTKQKEKLNDFIWRHRRLMSKPVTGHSNGIDYIGVDYSKMHTLYGVCHRASCFFMYLINGKDGPQGRIRLVQQRIEGVVGLHTYCYDTETDEYIDFTSQQLPDDWNPDNVRNIGSTLTRYNKWDKEYDVQVPSNLTLKLGRLWIEEGNDPMGLKYWLDNDR